MAGTKQAFAKHVVAGRWARHLAAIALSLTPSLVQAATENDCSAVNRGALNADLDPAASTVRQVALRKGETVVFRFQADGGPLGTVALLHATGSPRLLLVGPDGTSVAFVAAARGSFAFQYSHEGAEAAAFTASCASAGDARANDAPTVSSASPAGARPPHAKWASAEAAASVPPPIALDTGALAARDDGTQAPGIVVEQAIASLNKQPGGADFKLQWRDPRLKVGGPAGPEVDGDASGVNIGLNLKPQPGIMVGALAQFDQSGETLVGAPRGLLDQGWMVGPVTNVKLAAGLSLDAHAAWGVAESATDELAAKSGSTARRMVSARLSNTQSFGGWRLTPSLSVNHYQDALAPTTATHEAVVPYPGGFGRVDLGPEVAYRIDLDRSMFIEPKATIGRFWNFDSLSKLAPGAAAHMDARLKAEAGVTVGATDGTKLQAAGGVEEGEIGAANVWSGRLQLSVPMK